MLADQADILFAVVKRQVGHAIDLSRFIRMVKFDFERGAHIAARTDEPLLPNGDLREPNAIDGDTGIDVGVWTFGRSELATLA